MHPRTLATATVIAASLALTGCAGAADEAASVATTVPSATATPEPEHEATDEAMDEHMDDESMEEETASEAVTAGSYVNYTDGAIEATPGTKVLFFHATWCPNCRDLDEELVADGAPDGMTVFKVDYDTRTDLRQEYGVTLQTTVVYVGDNGEKLSSEVLYEDPSIASLVAAAP